MIPSLGKLDVAYCGAALIHSLSLPRMSFKDQNNRLVQERYNSSALAMESHLSCFNPSKSHQSYVQKSFLHVIIYNISYLQSLGGLVRVKSLHVSPLVARTRATQIFHFYTQTYIHLYTRMTAYKFVLKHIHTSWNSLNLTSLSLVTQHTLSTQILC